MAEKRAQKPLAVLPGAKQADQPPATKYLKARPGGCIRPVLQTDMAYLRRQEGGDEERTTGPKTTGCRAD